MNSRPVLFAVTIACFLALVFTAPREKLVISVDAPYAGKVAITQGSTPPFAAILSESPVVHCPARPVKAFSGQNSSVPFAIALHKLLAGKNHVIETFVETYIHTTYLPYFYDDSLAILRRLNI
jgi:hypothetical protein